MKYDNGKLDLSVLGANFLLYTKVISSRGREITPILIPYAIGVLNLSVCRDPVDIDHCLFLIEDMCCRLEGQFPGTLEETIQVFGFGAKKYAKLNYADGFSDLTRLTAALMRHYTQDLSGVKIDSESTYSHIAHCMCCLFMLWENLDGRRRY